MTTSTNRVIFLGPSLESNEAATQLEAHYLPPIRRGDLPRAIADGARAIGIVDGEFGQSLAVSVMEIRAGLEKGAHIWGAASMGALRAAECQSIGMCGVGWIFQKYAQGYFRADDEVALLFDPRSRRATTIPLVNIRWTLHIASEEGMIPAASEAPLIECARAIRFTERTHESLLEGAVRSPFSGDMRTVVELMKEEPLRTDRKRLDALLLLSTMAESGQSPRLAGRDENPL